ncbi:formylglycine-generating enzyme family protein [Lignipirellula cremea]|uniref:Serine/threonine-protein kinase pkn1 n=1 Tax=Lignipirellula cremea TaxID=2528010 RepID=A0A518E2S9_9BACT|nr:formylglycine-generating enzyme family protein [Lignipirellula cremea]QDU98397.1 Serine/threonine-protein kinase pkn1 [Lignipirellula cremea]
MYYTASFSQLPVAAVVALAIFAGLAAPGASAEIVSPTGIRMVPVRAGSFEMGMTNENDLKLHHRYSTYQREIHDYLEKPSFPVQLTHNFFLGATEVTRGQFGKFVAATGYQTDAERAKGAWVFHPDQTGLERFSLTEGRSWREPGFPQTDDHPVTCVSWRDAMAFCAWLGKEENAVYRLPTEAEWEFACRAGTTSPYCSGDDPDGMLAYGNAADAALYAQHPDDVTRQRSKGLRPEEGDGHVYTSPVGSFKPNAWGLYDMHGNVWEWCSDKYSDRIYTETLDLARERGSRNQPAVTVDPQGPSDTPHHKHGDWRSLRGGSWYVTPFQCRSTVRAFAEAADAFSYNGFRVLREVKN